MTAVCCLAVFGMSYCAEVDRKEREDWAKQNPVDSAKKNCISKVSGSRPACWSEGDKMIFKQLLKDQLKPVIKEVIQEEFANYAECHQYGR